MKIGKASGRTMGDLGFVLQGQTTYVRSPSNDFTTAFGQQSLTRILNGANVTLSLVYKNFGEGPVILENPVFTTTSALPANGVILISPTSRQAVQKDGTVTYTITYSGDDGSIRGYLGFSTPSFNTINPPIISNIRFTVTTTP